MSGRNCLRIIAIVLLFWAFDADAAVSVDNWTSTSSQTWNTSGNWSGGVPGTNSNATFTDNTSIQHSITLGGNRTVNRITFSNGTGSSGFTFDAAGSTSLLTLSNSTGITNNDASTQIFHNIVVTTGNMTSAAASGGLSYDEIRLTGNLTLSGSGNQTFGIDGGSMVLSGGDRSLVNNSTGTVSVGAIDLSISGDGAGHVLTFNGSGVTSVTGVIADGAGGSGGGIIATGTDRLFLSGTNTYTGSTTIQTAAIVQISNGAALGSTGGTTTIASGGVLELNSGTGVSTGESIVVSGTGISSGGAIVNVGGANEISGSVSLAATSEIQSNAGSLELSGTIQRSGTTSRALTVDGAGDTLISGQVAGTITTLTKNGTGTLTLSNSSNAYTGATAINAGTLEVSGTGELAGTGVTVASGASLTLSGGASTAAGTLSINGTGYNGGGALRSESGNNVLSGAVTLAGSATVMSATAGNTLTIGNYSSPPTIGLGANTLTFDGAGNTLLWANLTGSGGNVVKNGTGTLRYNATTNTYTGTTTVNAGTLILDNDNSTVDKAILGSLVIGNGSGGANSVLVQYGSGSADNKISNTAQVTINSDGKLDLNNRSDTIGSVILTGGHIDSGSGVLTLNGNVTVNTAGQAALIDGNLNLGNTTRTFTVANGGLASDLTVNARVTTGNIVKSGTGVMTLTGDNTIGYGGTTAVNQGTLVIQNSGSLGQDNNNSAGSGTSVASGASLVLDKSSADIAVGNEALSIAGTGASGQAGALVSNSGANSWSGVVTLTGSATIATSSGSTLLLSGDFGGDTYTTTVTGSGNTAISGRIATGTGGLVKDGSGTLTFTGTQGNTYSGVTSVNDGTLILNKTAGLDAIHGSSLVIGNGSGTADSAVVQLLADNQIADSAAVTIDATDGKLEINGHTETIGSVAGGGTLAIGAGSLTLTAAGDATFSGQITGSGTLIKSATSTGTLTLSSNTLNFGGNITANAGTLEFSGTAPVVAGTLTLGANSTLKLTGSQLTVGTINITGNTVIDFGSSSASILNATNFIIDPSVTLISIINWVNASDYFFATNWSGATLGTRGTGPELQVTFSGFSNSQTAWLSYDSQITPVPEPGTYGAILAALSTALVALRRRKSKRV